MAAATLKGPLGNEYLNNKTTEGNQAIRRRVFVQTENGCVLGIELDGSENACTVKKKLQLTLNVPTEETSLTCGDTVLKNDLSTVRNHSPLLLTRNCLHRSSSTPCLSPSAKDLYQRDQSIPIEVIGCSSQFTVTKLLVDDIVEAMKIGIDPIPVRGGLGGAYFFRNIKGENVAIVKPTDEEPFAPNNPKGFVGKALGQPGFKRSVRVGETGFREVAAYLLDYDGFANVPLTALVKVTHPIFNVNNDGVKVNGNNGHIQWGQINKLASFQQFIPHDCDASDHGTSSFPISAVHRIGILDVRILNTDRHAGNLLLRKFSDDGLGKFNQVDLVPIDHGLCLPESLEDPYFEWIHWPQASIPFSEDELQYIANLDPFHDSEMLRSELPMIHEACLRVLVLCTIFLKTAASFGLCLAQIGEMMTREFRGHAEEPSKLELICIEARSLLQISGMTDNIGSQDDDEEFQFDLEYEVSDGDLIQSLEDKLFIQKNSRQKNGGIGMNSVPKLENGGETQKQISISGASLSNGSADKQPPLNSSFVTVSDMNKEEWLAFLENFQKLLYPAFEFCKAGTVGQRLTQRLGTSCKF